ncbi:hypothetical protein ZWY2020_015434 [Hordeum vulgare]|nr:hypothetical protein ZWY2020_015434 [Hordeum vulgare]
MAKHTAPVRAATLLLVICLLATQARCRIMDDDGVEKISLPNGLCVHDVRSFACKGERCYCCRVGLEVCYLSMDECKRECVKKMGPSPGAGGGGGNTSPIA